MKTRYEKQLDRIRGALYGVAVGDALGGPVEFMSAAEIQRVHGRVSGMIGGGWLSLKPGEVTDDTQMTLCVADGMLDALEGGNGLSVVASVGRQFLAWENGKPKDIGGACAGSIAAARRLGSNRPNGIPTEQDWMEAARQTRRGTGRPVEGNGALMRTVYPGLYLMTRSDVNLMSRKIAEMTHRGDESTKACALYSEMVYLLTDAGSNYQSGSAEDFLHGFLNGTLYGRSVNEPAAPVNGGYVVDSMRIAVSCLVHAQSFEDAVCTAVNLGGDADTNAAITGGLAGAWFGCENIPARWIDALDPSVVERLEILAAAAAAHRNKK